jgi:hypothetical protein
LFAKSLAESSAACSHARVHIIPLHRIRLEMSVKFATLPKAIKRHFGIDHTYEREMLDHLMEVLAHCVVVKPDSVGFNSSTRPGKFGEDEPHPFPELEGKWTG